MLGEKERLRASPLYRFKSDSDLSLLAQATVAFAWLKILP
jgi:hypothetical protein